MYYSESSNLNSEQLLILVLESTNDSSFHPIWLLSRHKYKNYVRIKMTRSVNSQTAKGGEEIEDLTVWFILENSSSSSNKVCFKVHLRETCSSLITEVFYGSAVTEHKTQVFFFIVYL